MIATFTAPVSVLSLGRGDDQPTGSVSYEITHNSLHLGFRYRRGCEGWEDINQTIRFDRTRCHFGGERIWFLCPHCGARVAVLYAAGTQFLCRHCYKLPYSSQRESYTDRMNRKARKIRKRLGGTNNLFEPIWEKPKGMHWETF